MIESICAGHSGDAVRVAEKSVSLNARDPEMVSNLALAYLAVTRAREHQRDHEQAHEQALSGEKGEPQPAANG